MQERRDRRGRLGGGAGLLRSLGTVGLAALASASLGTTGCTVDVVLDYGSCSDDAGVVHDVGAEIAAGDGCNTCSCGSNGAFVCTERSCDVTCTNTDGSTRLVGETWEEGCDTCTCDPSGTIFCEAFACDPCLAPAPLCPEPGSPFCSSYAICDASFGWSCVVECSCDATPPPTCESPDMACVYTGPYCDPGGQWTCGDLVCCPTPVPPCPDLPPECTFVHGAASPICDSSGQWSCGEIACCSTPIPSCPEPPPGCVYTSGLACDLSGDWTCGELVCNGCCDLPPICDTFDPTCVGVAVCGPFGWECRLEGCAACVDPLPDCPLGTALTCDSSGWLCLGNPLACSPVVPDCPASMVPGCGAGAVCAPTKLWECAEECPGFCADPPPECPQLVPGCLAFPICTPGGWDCITQCS